MPVSDAAEVQTAGRKRTASELTPCRPLLKWPGGKRSELPLIAPRIPEHSRYFEPFFGGGSVYFDAIDAESHANDLHPDLMEFYRCVKQDDERFFKHLYSIVEDWELAPLVERDAIYYDCRERYNASTLTTVQRAADFFLLRELAYGGMFRVNANGHFNVPFGRAYAKNKNLREKVDHLRSDAVVAKLKRLNLSALDFADFLDCFEFCQEDFMFVDPPYDSSFSKYDTVDFAEQDQRRLAEALVRFTGRFMLVCKATPLIEDLYHGAEHLRVHHYEYQYKFNIKGRFPRSSTHAMITNYDPFLSRERRADDAPELMCVSGSRRSPLHNRPRSS